MWMKCLAQITLNSVKIQLFCLKKKSLSREFSGKKIQFLRSSHGAQGIAGVMGIPFSAQEEMACPC